MGEGQNWAGVYGRPTNQALAGYDVTNHSGAATIPILVPFQIRNRLIQFVHKNTRRLLHVRFNSLDRPCSVISLVLVTWIGYEDWPILYLRRGNPVNFLAHISMSFIRSSKGLLHTVTAVCVCACVCRCLCVSFELPVCVL